MQKAPRTLFHKTTDVTSSLFKGYSSAAADVRQIWIERSFSSLVDTLLVAPELIIKVTGPNFPLAMMVQSLGYEATAELIQTGAVRFILRTGTIMQDEQQPGSPLASIELLHDVFQIPELSARTALDAWCPRLGSSLTTKLSQLADSATVKIPSNAAFEFLTHLEVMQQRGEISLEGLTVDEKRTMAQDLLEATVIISEGWDWGEYTSSWSMIMQACELVISHDKFLKVTEDVFQVAGIPTLSTVFLDGRAAASDIVELRKKREAKDLRDWLWGSFESKNADEIKGLYESLVDNYVAPNERSIVRAARFIAGAGAGAILGSVAAEQLGAAVGAVVGAVPTAIDMFFVERFLRGRNPRRFGTETMQSILRLKPNAKRAPDLYFSIVEPPAAFGCDSDDSSLVVLCIAACSPSLLDRSVVID